MRYLKYSIKWFFDVCLSVVLTHIDRIYEKIAVGQMRETQ